MKIPGPDHPITCTPATKRWRVKFAGHVIADSQDVIVLKEASYPPVAYFPRGDVSMDYLSRTTHSTHCPYKGDASYYTALMDGQFAENGVWTYETPFPHMSVIAGRLAFYPNLFEIYEVEDVAVNPHHVDADVNEVVQHTDSGGGVAQKAHWAPNVVTPGEEGGVR